MSTEAPHPATSSAARAARASRAVGPGRTRAPTFTSDPALIGMSNRRKPLSSKAISSARLASPRVAERRGEARGPRSYAVDDGPLGALLFSLSVETLDDRIARDGPVKELDAVGWAIRLAKRLEALHSLGVAHGSVSPACILTSGSDRTSRAYIADVQLTTSSLAFQSPERVLGGDLSPADDTWAVACTLYTALTGTSPFAGGSDAETKQRILGGSTAP